MTAPAAAVSLAVPPGPAAGLAAGDLAYLFADPACASGLGAGPRRLAANGLRLDELDLMPARGWQRPEQCRVAGCPRTWRTPRLPLCRAHLHQQRELLKVGLEEFLTHPGVRPLPPCGPCQVTACVRGRDGTGGAYGLVRD